MAAARSVDSERIPDTTIVESTRPQPKNNRLLPVFIAAKPTAKAKPRIQRPLRVGRSARPLPRASRASSRLVNAPAALTDDDLAHPGGPCARARGAS